MVNWKKIWDAWDIRVVILFSLTLQIILIFFAPLRKRVSTYYLTLPLWCSYLLVEWAANFAVGHISDSNKGNGNKSAGENKVEDVLVFWAAFLLVYLGGPNYAKLMDECSSKIAANLPTNIEMIHEYHGDLEAEKSVKRKKLSDVEIVEEAHYFFEKFKGLIVDLIVVVLIGVGASVSQKVIFKLSG
ncbi:hypothetical protein CQW23_24954 [Capsicum baccatum]|uniref:DUF4220 domain-containing protein n=1 Tax=Capsicum baccatum TaxID=33114 RepID=A0A2G2VWA6_CAPBA|nr:hypothetical protein CQW23_24954 [Capsicum baccatum]